MADTPLYSVRYFAGPHLGVWHCSWAQLLDVEHDYYYLHPFFPSLSSFIFLKTELVWVPQCSCETWNDSKNNSYGTIQQLLLKLSFPLSSPYLKTLTSLFSSSPLTSSKYPLSKPTALLKSEPVQKSFHPSNLELRDYKKAQPRAPGRKSCCRNQWSPKYGADIPGGAQDDPLGCRKKILEHRVYMYRMYKQINIHILGRNACSVFFYWWQHSIKKSSYDITMLHCHNRPPLPGWQGFWAGMVELKPFRQGANRTSSFKSSLNLDINRTAQRQECPTWIKKWPCKELWWAGLCINANCIRGLDKQSK